MAAGGTAASTQQLSDQVNAASNYPSWEYALIQALGGTPTPENLKALYVWSNNEDGKIRATNNWLAISSPTGDPNAWGKIGTMRSIANYGQGYNQNAIRPGIWNDHPGGELVTPTYPTESAGVAATASFLQHGHQPLIDAIVAPDATVASIGRALRKDGGWASSDWKLLYQAAGMNIPVTGNGGPQGPNGLGTADPQSSTFTQCSSAHVIVGTPGLIGSFGKISLLNACQAKAIVGGIITGVGFIIMAGGIALTVGGAAGKEAAQVLSVVGNPLTKAQKVLMPKKVPTSPTTAP